MSLTKEDLQAISDLIDSRLEMRLEMQTKTINQRFDELDQKFEKKFEEQEKKFDKKFEEQKEGFKEMLIDNNILIAEHIQRIVSETEGRLSKEIKEIREVTADNCYEIALLKRKIS